MVYIFDTSSFIEMNGIYPDVFPAFWSRFNQLVASGTIMSVDQVRQELQQSPAQQHIIKWSETNKAYFKAPNARESVFIQQIFAVEKFQNALKKRNRRMKRPFADPFVVSAAYVLKGCVVTQETRTKGESKIPHICDYFKIECINLHSLLTSLGFSY